MKILIVEDEKRLADALLQIMKEQKYLADLVYDGAEAVEYARLSEYDVIVLDVMLPKKDGFQVVRELRAQKNATPVLMLTAKEEVKSKVQGLDAGADDYMTKPFSSEELLARIRALSRRQGEVVLSELSAHDLTLDLHSCDLKCGERSVRLGFKEFEVMKILLSARTAITSKEELIGKVWGAEAGVDDNNVEAYISFLRKKLEYLHSRALIRTIRKFGYRLEAQDD